VSDRSPHFGNGQDGRFVRLDLAQRQHIIANRHTPMSISFPSLLVMAAAVIYAVGALVVKRAADMKVGAWRTAFVANVITALFFQPLFALGGKFHGELWWQPAIVALCFVAGQWLTYVSLERGDVSVATPVLGIKVLLVAMFVTATGGESLPLKLWLAAALATAGIALLNRSSGGERRHVSLTIVTAGLAAAAFAVFDVLVQRWSPAWGLGRFLPLTIGFAAVLSLAFIPRFSAPLTEVPRAAWPWLLGGAGAIAAQSVVFVSTIARWGHAPQANVIYSSRGLWSVLLVWTCGKWMLGSEATLGGRVLAWRLAGAALMMSAIVLVLV
ncbi:MAG: EamA family transporter, partial [Chthoniobacteraceae bacterium]